MKTHIFRTREKSLYPPDVSSEIFHRITAGRKNITLNIHPERQNKINDERRPHREKGNVNKPGSDPGSGNTHPVPDRCAYTKYLPFDEVLQSVHTTKLEKIDKTPYIFDCRLTLNSN